MFYRLMLWLLSKRIVALSENHEGFQAAIRRRRCVIQFKTHNNKVARYFSFAGGQVLSEAKLHDSPSITFSFRTAAVARKLILGMAKTPDDKSVFIEAINQGKLRLQGDISLMTWFMEISDFFAPE